MKYNIITVTINPAIDTTILTDTISNEKISHIYNKNEDAAGKGLNVSKALAAFGVKSTPIILVGQKNKRRYNDLLSGDKLDTVQISHNGSVRENFTLVTNSQVFKLDEKGEILGENIVDSILNQIKASLSNDCDNIVVFAGSMPLGIDKQQLLNCMVAVKNLGCSLIVDTSSFLFEDYLLVKPDLIKPNESEFLNLLNSSSIDCCDEDFLFDSSNNTQNIVNNYIDAAKKLLSLKVASSLLISIGEHGNIYLNENKEVYQLEVPKIPVFSTTGAGDCTLAGFLYGVVNNLITPDALKYAGAFGTSSVMQKGTKPPLKSDVENIFKNVKVRKIDYV